MHAHLLFCVTLIAPFVLADIPWETNFYPHLSLQKRIALPVRRRLRDIETRIGAYDADRKRIGWLAQGEDEADYGLSKHVEEAEIFVLPNAGPSISNSIRIAGAEPSYLGAVLQADPSWTGGIGENGSNFMTLNAVTRSDNNAPRDLMHSQGYQTSNWVIPANMEYWTTFEFFNADQNMTTGAPRFFWSTVKNTLYGAENAAHLPGGHYRSIDRVYLRFEPLE